MTSSSRRPEHCAPPEMFYNEREAVKYTSSSRIIAVQREMSERAVELLALPPVVAGGGGSRLLLDLGCGSALSGQVLSRAGHVWLGVDIAPAMLAVAQRRMQDDEQDSDAEEDEEERAGAVRGCGDLLLADLGAGLPLRPGSCDGAVSVSALQWLCQADRATHSPVRRLRLLFGSLYACLARGARAVFQFYPENAAHVQLVTTEATRAGFGGGLVVDYPNSSRAKKVFLVLMTGGGQQLPAPLGVDSAGTDVSREGALFSRRDGAKHGRSRDKPAKYSRHWILKKKERRRLQGRSVGHDSKYTGRKRKAGF